MEIAVPAKLEQFVHAQVRAGKYVDANDVVRDALRRLQETEAPDTPAGLVREAINIATQAQRDVLGLLQRADRETDFLHQLLGAASHAVDSSLDVARKIPVAREVEKVVRGSLEGVTTAAERGEQEARALRQGLEGTAKMLGALASVLERVNQTTAAIGRVGTG
ncbi:MAG: ribbon-helix-helix domain-containing protein [Actinomycetota bacterium]